MSSSSSNRSRRPLKPLPPTICECEESVIEWCNVVYKRSFKLEFVPSCLISCDLELLSLELELLEIINLASSLDHFAILCLLAILLDQNRYPIDTSLIHIESRKSPIAVLFVVDTGRISIRYYKAKEYHSECSGNITRIMCRTLRYHLCSLFVNNKSILELCPNKIYIDLLWLWTQ
ncbi:hypothetical protein Tco_0780438 [Tanacetum coccineum]